MYASYTNLSWVLGDFIWTAIDYIGESAIGNAATTPDIQASAGQPWQWHVSFCGDIDIMGMQKPQAFYRACCLKQNLSFWLRRAVGCSRFGDTVDIRCLLFILKRVMHVQELWVTM